MTAPRRMKPKAVPSDVDSGMFSMPLAGASLKSGIEMAKCLM